jgi:4'-phosphopantetheinyl transferase
MNRRCCRQCSSTVMRRSTSCRCGGPSTGSWCVGALVTRDHQRIKVSANESIYVRRILLPFIEVQVAKTVRAVIVGVAFTPSQSGATAVVDVWWIDLGVPCASAGVLPTDEVARVAAIRDAAARTRWLRSRVALREILAAVSDRAPAALRFELGRYGKPVLEDGGGIQFSLSRSHDLCGVAVAVGHPVGIDVERVAEIGNVAALATQFLAPDEAAGLRGDSRALLMAWTRREALAKATGVGLQQSLREMPADAAAWHLVELVAPAPYVTTLAMPLGASVRAILKWSYRGDKDQAGIALQRNNKNWNHTSAQWI